MNKKIKLYITLFIISACFSTTASFVFAADSKNAETKISYEQPAGENPGTLYEISIPSSQTFPYGYDNSTIDFTITGSENLPDGYKVYVDIDPVTFDSLVSTNDTFRMYTSDRKYYRGYYLLNVTTGSRLYYNDGSDNAVNIATFTNASFESKTAGLKIKYREDASTDMNNNDGGQYTGTIYFKIHGQQE